MQPLTEKRGLRFFSTPNTVYKGCDGFDIKKFLALRLATV